MKLKSPLIIIPTEKPKLYESSGVQPKPPECKFCPNNKSTGFVPDWLPEKPKLLLVFSSPEREDPIAFHPWAGDFGWWKENKLLKPLGLTRYDVAITHVLRCYSGRDKFGKLAYPAKSIRIKAENCCRAYDKVTFKSGKRQPVGIVSFVPDTFVITFDIADLRNGSAFIHLFQKDLKKGLEIYENGGKPAILFGAIPTSLFAPYAIAVGSGGIKSWRGHIFNSSWKDLNIKTQDIQEEVNEFEEYDNARKARKPKSVSSGERGFSFSKAKLPAWNKGKN